MTDAARCYHCGEALPPEPPTIELDGARRAVCCTGCAAAASWIRDAGLGDYYRLRSAEGSRVDAEPPDYLAWDRADILAEHSRETPAGREMTLVVEGMHCAACAWLIDRALRRVDGVIDAAANAVTCRVEVAWDPRRTPLSRVLARLAALGYRPHLAPGVELERERRRERNGLLLRLGVAALGAMQAMMFAEALYLDTAGEMSAATRDFFRWIAFLVSTPVVFYSGWPFLAGMARELRARRLGMDTLVASSVLLAYGASLVETLRHGPHVWFDAAVMFVFLLLAARFLERMARQQANARTDALARARPALAWRESVAGREQVPLSALMPGDVVLVGAGDAVPGDGVLLDAAGAFDESLLTGESTPVRKQIGEPVWAGSLCGAIPARIALSRTGQDTRLSQLTRLVERAQNERPRLARLADLVASRFVLALFVVATVVFAAWWQIDRERAFEVALAVLVVSCPCALSLAIPAALAAAHGALARIGVLGLRADALETLARADVLLLDKTGTLTEGRPRLQTVQAFGDHSREEVLALATALERDSGHPLAQAFFATSTRRRSPLAGDQPPSKPESPASGLLQAMRAVVGHGVEGVIDGNHYRLGRADFAAGRTDDGAIWLGTGGEALARFELADSVRADAVEAVGALSALGLNPEVLSGDGESTVERLCHRLGIDRWRARQTPEDKLARVRALQTEGRIVLMAGDGLNDAPVLAGADVSVALAGGAPLAHSAADFVLTGESLIRLPQAIALARRTRRIVRQNLAWAVGYNLLALPFAAAGLVAPWLAALGMAASSLLVTLNALRLAKPTRSPAGAQRNPGHARTPTPDFAALHPGYDVADAAEVARRLP